jgi:aldehyde:ferredoxin oxidoreductase
MTANEQRSPFDPSSVTFRRCTINLRTGGIQFETITCRNLEDVLGGIGRSFQFLAEREIKEAYCPENPLVVNTGLLTGTTVMTGLRAYFSAYSPLKCSDKGLPAAMWAAGSDKFGPRLKWTGIDEVVFEDRSPVPVYVVFSEGQDGPVVELKPAGHLLGLDTHQKIMALHRDYPYGHFAVIGPAGENYETVYMAAVALSTENQLKSGEDKCRFAGRGGMGSVMGYKNLIGLVATGADKLPRVSPEVGGVNKTILRPPVGGSTRYQPTSQGGGGGTWTNQEVMHAFCAAPENNFRPSGTAQSEGLFRGNVEKELDVKSEACFRCGIRCHNNLYHRNADGSRGEFIAKFDYEPLNLLGPNLGIYNGRETAELIKLGDNLGMDSISIASTVSYVLDYNARHPETPLFNGATFGQYEKIRELIQLTGEGKLPDIGRGVKRLSVSLGETAYAMHVKGLELPAFLPETNPGYIFAIAGGHMSMQTQMLLAKEGKCTLEEWTEVITKLGLLQVGFDAIGLCKFLGVWINNEVVARGVQAATGYDISKEELEAAVRRIYLRGLALELRQGYTDEEYTLPEQVFENPNPNVRLPAFATREFMRELKNRVWDVFIPEMKGLIPTTGSKEALC